MAGLAIAAPAYAAEPKAVVEGVEDDTLRAAIQRAIGDASRPAETRFEARRRARDAAQSAIAVLRSEGYYGYEIEPDVAEADPPHAVVRATPGPRFEIQDTNIDWVDDPPVTEVAQAAEAAAGLPDGAPGRSADILAAEGRIVALVQNRGYADVVAAPREVVVDHADRSVRPTFRIAAGELVRLDGVDLTTQGRTNRAWVLALAPWRPGEVYDPKDVAELERRLLDTGVYDSVTVALAPKAQRTPDGLRPVIVSLSDRARRTIELGAGYSTSEGVGIDGRWTRYNVLGRADTLALRGRLAELEQRLDLELALPHWRRPQQTLKLGVGAFQMNTDAYEELGAGVRADVTRRYGKTSFVTLGASVDYSKLEEVDEDAFGLVDRQRDLVLLTGLGALSLDRSNDPLDPRRGWRVEARAEPTLVVGDTNVPYLKGQAQGSYYLPFGAEARTVLASRLRLGAIVGGTLADVPTSRRFFAGGGGSVRGYSYQGVGPRFPDNTPSGGRSLIEGSVELRHDLTRRWGLAAFVDAGAVGEDQFPKGRDLSVGAGIGVRYNLGFGPIRADIAIPLDKREGDPSFQIYLSIGQSF
ncbi:MAG: outer membrane protein assembly factor [Caulobacteraceae bacterium]|nr:outer membrane protein assembly factor [Caulobacteraceae bacterium]